MSAPGSGPAQDRSRIYFTWPDGRFGYECRDCGACCKGLGIGLDASAGQVDDLINLYPGVASFLRKRGATWTAFNPRGRCWFLTGEGLCRVEKDHGRSHKPASCRLFPFNRVFRIGAWMIVDYNSVICPLQVVPAGRPPGISHDSIMGEIECIRDVAVVGTQLPAQRPDEEGQRFVSRERGILQAAFQAADAETPDMAAVWRAQAKEGAFDRARARVSQALETLTGQSWCAPTGMTARTALWLTPSMRFNELYGPRAYASRTELSQCLADVWLAWLHFVAVGARLCDRDLDLREATSIFTEQMPLGYLAARWSHAPTMEPGAVTLPGAADSHDVVRTFAQAAIDNRTRRRPLGELLAPLLDSLPASQRVVSSRMIEPLLPSIRWRRARTR